MTVVALYARVSSEKQAKADTIASQIATLEAHIHSEGYVLAEKFGFIDNGYSGSNLNRPALEQLRDKVRISVSEMLAGFRSASGGAAPDF